MSADDHEMNTLKQCCNPFKCHEKPVTKGLRMITDATRNRPHSLQIKPDNQLCTKCRKKLTALPQQSETLSQSETVNPSTATGRTYILSQDDVEMATRALAK